MYDTIASLLQLAETQGVPVWRVVLENEMRVSACSEAAVWQALQQRYEIMCASAQRALEQPLQAAGGLIDGVASTQYTYAKSGNTLSGEQYNVMMARALSCSECNAAMGKICAAPTAGSCGILPAVLMTVGEMRSATQQEILQALLTASGIGAVITQNATVSGAEGGCQAECGTAAAMAAAAAVQLAHGADEAIPHAVAIALMNCMGLVCDPVAGLVQMPCAQRNASQAVNAVISADLALGGMRSVIPADEVIDAMLRVGHMLPPALRETAGGGVAATPTARQLAKEIFDGGPHHAI